MNLIVAADLNWGIGYKGNLLIKIKEDLQYFKEKTMGHIVVMGRVTYESLPKRRALPGRRNIVLTRDTTFRAEGFGVCHNVFAINELAKVTDKEVFIIGGEAVYKAFLPYIKKAYVTRIYREFQADKFVPNFDELPDWSKVGESEPFDTKDGVRYRFVEYCFGVL